MIEVADLAHRRHCTPRENLRTSPEGSFNSARSPSLLSNCARAARERTTCPPRPGYSRGCEPWCREEIVLELQRIARRMSGPLRWKPLRPLPNPTGCRCSASRRRQVQATPGSRCDSGRTRSAATFAGTPSLRAEVHLCGRAFCGRLLVQIHDFTVIVAPDGDFFGSSSAFSGSVW